MDDGSIFNWRMGIADQHLQMFAGSYPASSLFHYPTMGTVVDTFLMLIDEGEPTQCPISSPSINQNVNWQTTDENETCIWNLSEIIQQTHFELDNLLVKIWQKKHYFLNYYTDY